MAKNGIVRKHAKDTYEDIRKELDNAGIVFRLIPYHHLDEITSAYSELWATGIIHEKVFNTYLAYLDKDKNTKFPEAVSLFITATPQPQLRVTFHTEEQTIRGIIPPTYARFGEGEGAEPILKKILDPLGFSIVRGYVPLKRMAVQSGLAEYGRNNLTYIPGSGSFYKLAAYFSDFPSVEDFWREPVLADSCKNCSACMKACPTGALAGDRFAVHAEQCLTFVNELATPFPDWVRSEWHHCLIGCMRCQAICPRNKPFMNLFDDRAEFTIQETDDILSGTPLDKLPETAQHKLEESELSGESYATLK